MATAICSALGIACSFHVALSETSSGSVSSHAALSAGYRYTTRLPSRRHLRRPLLRGAALLDVRPFARASQRLARLSASPWTVTPRAADRDNRHHRAVARPGGDTDLPGHVRLEHGTGLAIVLGHGTLWGEGNIVLPIRRDAELHRHGVDWLPLTVSHDCHQVERFILGGIHRSLQRQVVLGALPKARSPHQGHQGQSKPYHPCVRIASLLGHSFRLSSVYALP